MALAVKMNCAVCDRVALVATTLMVELPTVAESATLNVTGWFVPPASEKDDDGEAVTPGGIPCSMIPTEPVKPFCAVTVMVTGEVVVPTSVETDEGEAEMLKSGGGATLDDPPPPQPISPRTRNHAKPARRLPEPAINPPFLTAALPVEIGL